jgi:Bifunctional DNA primase/polymerase, N-terminal
MTGSSNSNDGEPKKPEAAASASSTAPSEPLQLDLFEPWTGVGERAKEPPAPSANPDSLTARGPFADRAEVYRRRGYWPRPITPGTKACHVRDWQKPDSDLSDATLTSWLTSHAHFGIGLLMGSPFPDGTAFGALDIDRDEYVRVGRASFGHTPSGRIGRRGAAFFVRVRGRLSNPEFTVRGEAGARFGKVAECLFVKKLCVIPPTIHPDLGQAYRWIGRPLHDVEFTELPIVEMDDV